MASKADPPFAPWKDMSGKERRENAYKWARARFTDEQISVACGTSRSAVASARREYCKEQNLAPLGRRIFRNLGTKRHPWSRRRDAEVRGKKSVKDV